MTEKIRRSLKSIDLFSELPETFADQLTPFCLIRQIRKGETIFCQGEPSPYCFGIVSGEVTIQRVSNDRNFAPKTLSILGPGSLFGEQALFKETPRTAMALASGDGELVAISGQPLRDWLQNDSAGVPLLLGILQNTLSRLRQTSHELSLVYGIGRYLSTEEPFVQRVHAVSDFLRASLEGIDEILIYQRSLYWDEFIPVTNQLESPPELVMPLENPLARQLADGGVPVVSRDPKQTRGFAAVSLLPFIDPENQKAPVQGFLWAASRKQSNIFTPGLMLLLATAAVQTSESVLRQRRQEDQQAQQRLHQNRQSFRV
jgi:CRP/FNR family transcriptional regulator, cyclic AMP receptor protein